MNKLKYTNYEVVFQEVPNETTLAINISGCPHKCEGCHSQYLADYIGDYLSNDIDKIISKYHGMITCVCFMGGDQNIEELNELLYKVKRVYDLKTCIYSGCDNVDLFDSAIQYIDYLKIGKYDFELGGLNNKTTNQKFYKINNCTLTDITSVFWSKQIYL